MGLSLLQGKFTDADFKIWSEEERKIFIVFNYIYNNDNYYAHITPVTEWRRYDEFIGTEIIIVWVELRNLKEEPFGEINSNFFFIFAWI